jgi:hypothetical protein
VYLQRKSLYTSFNYFLISVAMGVLDYSPSELFLSGADILFPSPQTSRRIIQIEIEKGRFPRIIHKSRRNCIYPRSHLSRRFVISLGISLRHRHVGRRHPCISTLYSNRMESCGPSDRTTSFISSSISAFTCLGIISLWHLLLCKCIFFAYILSSCIIAECRTIVECGTPTSITPSSDCDNYYRRFCRPKVSHLKPSLIQTRSLQSSIMVWIRCLFHRRRISNYFWTI